MTDYRDRLRDKQAAEQAGQALRSFGDVQRAIMWMAEPLKAVTSEQMLAVVGKLEQGDEAEKAIAKTLRRIMEAFENAGV